VDAVDKSEVVTLRIRSETGKRTIIIRVLRSDQMQKIYDMVLPYIEHTQKAFELRSNFPNRAYERKDKKSLEELGLAPSSALVIHSREQPKR